MTLQEKHFKPPLCLSYTNCIKIMRGHNGHFMNFEDYKMGLAQRDMMDSFVGHVILKRQLALN
jgi:hypothetical protein